MQHVHFRHRSAIEAFGDDPSADKVIDLSRVFGPRNPQQGAVPPPIGVGEITSSARRDVGALELIADLRARAQRGLPPRPGGLTWYTPTGLIRHAVVAPDQSRILWQGTVGRLPGLAGMTPDQREAAVRRHLTQVTGQHFRDLPPGHRGPDLVPRPRLRVRPPPHTRLRRRAFDAFEQEALFA